jgi:hypothetical protein
MRLGGPGTVRQTPAQPATLAATVYGGSSPQAGSGGVQLWHLGAAAPLVAAAWLVFLRWSLPG